GIGFDATCSLVALDQTDQPVSVSPTKEPHQNVIVWMDHRAMQETDEINQTGDEVLKYVGGKISPEMEIPKLMWLKRNLPEQYRRTAKYLDLGDFMVYRASGNDLRSVCTKVCKWTYLAHEKRWSHKLFNDVGLEDLTDNDRIGKEIAELGSSAGPLTGESADQLGLSTNTTVAVGIIDAHAGGLGVLGKNPETTLAIIGGTSSCHMASSQNPLFVKGIWGPYYGAMVPGLWLNEGGQSATGSLVDFVIRDSSYYAQLMEEVEKTGIDQYQILNDEIIRMEESDPFINKNFHLLGYFHGNRSPRANPHLKGMISGLSLNETKTELAKKYLAAIQSVAYGTRHIIKELNNNGHQIKEVHMCGGGTKNPIWLREHADITGCEMVLTREPEAVLLGSAILAAAASKVYPTIKKAMSTMSEIGRSIQPRHELKSYHDLKYRVFHEMYEDQVKYEHMMDMSGE
ncbi:MAG: FGGY-family carbohydrate kinase, partial [Desulfobacterales bacterium]|nr:FGGY-family carbohydrate kinase [Desulfobacterales bacterium]